MESILKKYAYECPSDDTVKAICITKEVVEDGADAIIARKGGKQVAEA